MGNHRRHAHLGAATVDVSIATPHWSHGGAEVSAGAVEQRFAEGCAPGLVADEGGEEVLSLDQRGAERGADRFLTAAQINASDDFACLVEA